MSEDEFWLTTPRYLQARISASTNSYRLQWTLARQQGYWSILPHIGKKKITPQDLGRFDWEKVKRMKNPFSSNEELKAALKAFEDRVKKAFPDKFF